MSDVQCTHLTHSLQSCHVSCHDVKELEEREAGIKMCASASLYVHAISAEREQIVPCKVYDGLACDTRTTWTLRQTLNT